MNRIICRLGIAVAAVGFLSFGAPLGCGKPAPKEPVPAKGQIAPKPLKAPVSATGASSPVANRVEATPTRAEATPPPTPRYSYNADGRRDPFLSLVSLEKASKREIRPPLQRVSLNQVQVIGIVWGSYGYSAMVQTPDGKGYTVRQGTLIGPTGVVRRITEKAVEVEEPYTDLMGEKKMRVTKLTLHPQQEGEE